MANQLLSPVSPPDGFSIARKAMQDAVAYYLANGGPAVARQEVGNVASSLKYYPDCSEAYLEAMAMIKEAENVNKPMKIGILSPKLSTPKAMLMWRRLQQAGLIDDCYQPIKLTRAKMAVIADEMMYRLISDNEKLLGVSDRWTHFETLWGKKNLRTDHYRNVNGGRLITFRENIQLLFSDIE